MEQTALVPTTVFEAFEAFTSNDTLLALPLIISAHGLQPLPAIQYPPFPDYDFQAALPQLDSIVDTKTPLYLLIRRNASITIVTYVPHRANTELKERYLGFRHELVNQLGPSRFSSSLICKEPGEITDARSWDERDGHDEPWNGGPVQDSDCNTCADTAEDASTVKDLGYQKSKCRLCDRRMKNKIEPGASVALKELREGGNYVQLSVDLSTETLILNSKSSLISPSTLSTSIPTAKPSYTFYRHPDNSMLYFIYCSPDSASVKERMTHTIAIPGLVNVIAKEQGVNVDQKIEIHDPEDLEFKEKEGKDGNIGKFRSMYLLNEKVGTESVWEGMPTV